MLLENICLSFEHVTCIYFVSNFPKSWNKRWCSLLYIYKFVWGCWGKRKGCHRYERLGCHHRNTFGTDFFRGSLNANKARRLTKKRSKVRDAVLKRPFGKQKRVKWDALCVLHRPSGTSALEGGWVSDEQVADVSRAHQPSVWPFFPALSLLCISLFLFDIKTCLWICLKQSLFSS